MTDFKQGFNEAKKFIIIGATSTVINYGVFFLSYKIFHVNYALAAVLGYLFGLAFGYIYNRSWTFKPAAFSRYHEVIQYVLVYGFSLILNVSLLNLLVSLGKINPLLANIIAMAAAMCTNFLGLKYIVFNESAQARVQNLVPLFSKAFWAIVLIKLVSGSLFGSRFMTEGFIPFVRYFSTIFQNPYTHFLNASNPAFPYPAGMLYILSIPYMLFHWTLPQSLAQNSHVQLLLMRLPLLALDVIIYVLLCKLIPTKEKKVLWLYFASPIVFYINYYHGQLDVVPTAILLVSLFLLIKKRMWWAFIILGLGIAVKTHVLIALPFYLLYLYRDRVSIGQLVKFSMIALGVFVFLNLFLFSPAFLQTVFNNPEQRRLFFLAIPFNFKDLKFFIAPALILAIFYKFASYKKLNADSLVLVLGLTFTVLVALVPPTQGWYYWVFPFLIFYLIKYEKAPKFILLAINVFFILYFVFSQDSDIFSSLRPTFASASGLLSPYVYLGINAGLLENLFFTGLETSLLATALWNYRIGTQTTELYQKKKQRFILGIAGDSGVGKSTLANILEKVMGSHNAVVLNGDDVHKWERQDPRWQEITHLNPKGNRIHTDLEHAQALLKGESVRRLAYDHATGTFVGPMEVRPNKFIVFQGLMPFILDSMRQLYDLKIYVEADEALRSRWKMLRDQSKRGKSPEQVKQQIESRKPDAEKFIYPQKGFADWTIRYVSGDAESFYAEYIFKNSVFLDVLIEELADIPSLRLDHAYDDLNYQRITVAGEISAEAIREIGYKLFPNMFDLVENQPVFEEGLKGIHQLFFINYLNNFYRRS